MSPRRGNVNRIPRLFIDSLWKNTVRDEKTGCWLWQGFKWQGHGYIRWSKWKSRGVHIVSAWIFFGYEPTDSKDNLYQINHKQECPNRNCWNPKHLYIGNQRMNVRDSMTIGTHKEPPPNIKKKNWY